MQLALFRYRLPRLRGKGLEMSQQAGGIGARRGPARRSSRSTGVASNARSTSWNRTLSA
ncbi:MAG: hypothetical protein M5U19_15530 [Microthrixaceae bacterium]|nr:hypothetical protein [Microthrixaceae bacterium]